jgi:NADH dehydrogenase/NADH:ubiquinone oxidoreductase subunit G
MSNTNEYLDDDDNDEQVKPTKLRDHEKAQAKRIKELEENEAKAAEAIRKLAFIEAGVQINDPAAKYFVKGYDGELSADAIRVAAIEAKLIADPSNDPTVEAERAAALRVAEAGRVNEGAVVPADLASRVAGAKTPGELEQIVALVNAGQPL